MLKLVFILFTITCFTLLTGLLTTVFKREIVTKKRIDEYFLDRYKNKNNLQIEEKENRLSKLFQIYWKKGIQQVNKSVSKDERRKIDGLLRDAGYPFKLSSIEIRLIQILLSVGGGLLIFLLIFPIAEKKTMVWLMTFAISLLGFRYPIFYLNKKKMQRNKEINKNTGDFFDTVNLLIEAGMGLDAALVVVCQRVEGPLSEEFKRTLEDMKLGKSRREAFYDLRKRVPSDSFQSIITSLIQADQLGIGMAKVLRNLTTRIREQRIESAREQAMKAPIKMLFPMVIFIFPSLFIVILGPLVIQLITKGLGG